MQTVEWTDAKLEERLERIDERFKRVDQRFDEVDRRFERVDQRFDEVDRGFERVDQRFDEVDRRITEGRVETGKRFDRIESDIGDLRTKLDRILIGLVLGFPAVLGTIIAKGG
jgi:DNA anti-recombination protein RmuC